MKFEKQKDAVVRFCKKVGKRNFILIGAVLLIGVAVLLNFMLLDTKAGDGFPYGDGAGQTGNTPGGENDNSSSAGNNTEVDSYFASVEVSRSRARDEALEVLQSVVENEAANEAAKNEALSAIAVIAKEMEQESNIESLILAKGFSACVAVISDGKATVVVDADTLLPADLAQINEIVYEQSGIKPASVKIIQR